MFRRWDSARPLVCLASGSEMSETPAPPQKPKRIHWRSGLRRIFYALSVLYFGGWALAGFGWISNNPFFLSQPRAPSQAPLRELAPLESHNPRVQQLMSLVEARNGGGIGYERDFLRRWAADRGRTYSRELPQWQSNLVQEATRLLAAERTRYVVLPNPNDDLVAYPADMTLSELKEALEQNYARWRWPVRIDYAGACILNGAYSCSSSYGEQPFQVDLAIHCQANLDLGPYTGQSRINELLPTVCGELGRQLYAEALRRQATSRGDFGTALGFMVGIWLAVFAFGKVFWWIIDGFSGKRSRFDPSTTAT
jgi:hypothetical protein